MRHLVIDVETVAIDDVATYLEPVSAPSNYKDELKIKAYIEEETKRQTEKAALDIDLARIVAIGWHWTGAPERSEVMVIRDEIQERTILGEFWHRFWPVYIPGHTVAVTFNGLGYDLPLLLRRSLYLGVTAPKLQLDRYKHIDAIDLMQILCLDGRLKMHGLQFYANRFKIPVEQDIAGADIGKAVADGDWAAVERHCAADVQTTYLLAKRMGVL
jgi:predicted PolB exonuclease-like 3'-5' exonuclease